MWKEKKLCSDFIYCIYIMKLYEKIYYDNCSTCYQLNIIKAVSLINNIYKKSIIVSIKKNTNKTHKKTKNVSFSMRILAIMTVTNNTIHADVFFILLSGTTGSVVILDHY